MKNVEKTAELLVGINLVLLLRCKRAIPRCSGKLLHALLVLGRELQFKESSGGCRRKIPTKLNGTFPDGRAQIAI